MMRECFDSLRRVYGVVMGWWMSADDAFLIGIRRG